MEMAGGRQAVAGVVADTARHDGAALTEPGELPAGRFHQPVGGDAETLVRERVCGFDLGATESR
jgi:hypothetical protein